MRKVLCKMLLSKCIYKYLQVLHLFTAVSFKGKENNRVNLFENSKTSFKFLSFNLVMYPLKII